APEKAKPLGVQEKVQKPATAAPAPAAKQPVKPVPAPAIKQEKPPVKPAAAQPHPVAKPAPRPPVKPEAPRVASKPKEPVVEVKKGPEPLRLEPMTVGDFAERSQKQVSDVIMTLLKQGVVANKNQLINEKVVAQLAKHYELVPEEKVHAKPKEAVLK